jgi:hypothetical protein
MDIFLGKINPAEKKQPIQRGAFFSIIQHEWGNPVKEVP